MRRFLLLGALVLVAFVGLPYATRAIQWMRFNQVVFLMNQERWQEAEAQLERLGRVYPNAGRLAELEAELLVRRGGTLPVKEEKLVAGEEDDGGFYLQGVSHFRLGREVEAVKAFGGYLRSVSGKQVSPCRRKVSELAMLALGSTVPLTLPPDTSGCPSLERELGRVLEGRAWFRLGNIEKAAAILKEVRKDHSANWVNSAVGATAVALTGDFSFASYLLGASGETTRCLARVRDELLDQGEREKTAVVAASAGTNAQRILDRKRARVWLGGELAEIEGTSMSAERNLAEARELATSSSLDVRNLFLYAEALERTRRLAEAYRVYQAAQAISPSLSGCVRLQDLKSGLVPFDEEYGEFVDGLHPVVRFDAADLHTSNGRMRYGYLVFVKHTLIEVEVQVTQEGRYELACVLNGDKASGIGPLVNVRVDGKLVGLVYVSREGWDAYSLPLRLGTGRHRVVLEYENNPESGGAGLEDRNLYLKTLLFIPLGAG